MKGRRLDWSAEELAWIEARREMRRRELFEAFRARFGRHGVSLLNPSALCKRRGWLTGRTGRYEPGIVPLNKGKTMPYHPNSARTRFQKGRRTGRAAEIYQPVGAERLSKDGYPERKIHDGMPMQSRWRAIHLIRWEALHGPVPEGHALKCLDGDKGNTDPSNWKLVPRAILPRLNGRFGRGYDRAPAELKPAIMAIAELEHAARKRRKEVRHDRPQRIPPPRARPPDLRERGAAGGARGGAGTPRRWCGRRWRRLRARSIPRRTRGAVYGLRTCAARPPPSAP